MVQLTPLEQRAREMICHPLDGIESIEGIIERVTELRDYVGMFKVGKELIHAVGTPAAVRAVHKYGGKVFLDNKEIDIPQTVKNAVYAAKQHGVYMLNVHAQGGKAMMEAAMDGARAGSGFAPQVIAVTVLTSLDASALHDQLLIREDADTVSYVRHLARLTVDCGLNGIVCSAQDLADGSVRTIFPSGSQLVTPGIQGLDGTIGSDQVRIASPYAAARNGSTTLVVGRAISTGKTPELRQQAAYAIMQDAARGILAREAQ